MKDKQYKTLTFPQIGNYYIPATYLFSHILNVKVLTPPKITNKTIELGNKNSPQFVCMPFKYTLGTLIEALDKKDGKVDILVQLGGGCRYGYYSELQEEILKNMGYDFTFINLVSEGKTDLLKIYKKLKEIDPKFKISKALYYLLITIKMIKYMDKIDDYIRQNIGFEVNKGEFIKTNKKMLHEFSHTKSLLHLIKIYKKYKRKFKKIKVNKPKNPIKIGIIGELYTVMEPFSNYFLEQELAKFNMSIKRFTNANYLVFKKKRKIKKYLKHTKEYIKYKMGADASDNIARTKEMALKGYDGIIHIKSSFCTPEIAAMPIINKICKKYNIPLLFFSFDANTSEVGIKTRLEAFNDMLEMRKENGMLFRN